MAETTVTKRSDRIRIEQHSIGGMLWFGGWLFTTGLLHLTFWKGVAALVAWPYFLGAHFSGWLQ